VTCAGPGPTCSPTGPGPAFALAGLLLRHGRVWRGGSTWTSAHERWLLAQRFDDAALSTTYAHYRATLTARDAALDAIEADLATWYEKPPFADAVARLSAYRGVTRLGALTLASEVGDWRRFASAPGVHGLLRADPQRVLQRRADPAGPHHQDRQRAPARPAGRVRLPPTSTAPRPPSSCAAARKACHPRSSPAPGRRSCGCAAASVACTPANSADRWWSSPSLASWPASCGPRWSPSMPNPKRSLHRSAVA
jgi:hypothetical protein